MGGMIPIFYAEFWDVPRSFAFRRGDRSFYFQSGFDETLDDYSSVYKVYELSNSFDLKELRETSEASLERSIVSQIGEIAVDEVEFDASRRESVSSASVARFF